MKGMIVIWSGAIVDIPHGWALCDGTQGTPDLRERFVICAGQFIPPGSISGDWAHTHPFTGDGHVHPLIAGANIAAGADYDDTTDSSNVSGTTDSTQHVPPFYALAFIMKL